MVGLDYTRTGRVTMSGRQGSWVLCRLVAKVGGFPRFLLCPANL